MVIRRAGGSPPPIEQSHAADPRAAEARADSPRVATVAELTRRLANVLEGEFGDVTVQGEISGWNRASSGHTYFTLKDDAAVLSGVLWKSRTLRHPIRDGMKVVARGRITVYAPRGSYQLDCVSMAPLGEGELQAALETLKKRLAAEGLFDADRKRPLPEFPARIGVITSPTGAAIRDILTTLERRMPSVRVVFRPAQVQGAGAAEDVAAAIDQMNRLDDVDVLIVGRGGGSTEDLWAFNEEVVARAIARSRIPVISAVGHEIDFTIADFAADVRAATPTAAAELAVRDRAELLAALREIESGMLQILEAKLRTARRELASLLRSRGLSRPLDLVRAYQQRIDDLAHRSTLALRRLAARSGERLLLVESALRALNPTNVLARGYAIVERDGVAVGRAAGLAAGDHVRVRMHDGALEAVISGRADDEAPPATP